MARKHTRSECEKQQEKHNPRSADRELEGASYPNSSPGSSNLRDCTPAPPSMRERERERGKETHTHDTGGEEMGTRPFCVSSPAQDNLCPFRFQHPSIPQNIYNHLIHAGNYASHVWKHSDQFVDRSWILQNLGFRWKHLRF